ncbi:MAG: DsbA family protein [Phycisphaerales bacterium JB038]
MRSRLVSRSSDIATILLIVLAVGMAGFRGYQYAQASWAQKNRYSTQLEDWPQFSAQGLRHGPQDALVTVVQWGDFLCPFCARAFEHSAALLTRYPDEVALVHRHFPIDSVALAAAVAFECAGLASSEPLSVSNIGRFYQSGGEYGGEQYFALGLSVAADSTEFAKCMTNGSAKARLLADSVAAVSAGITGTPLILINGRRVRGFPGAAIMDSLVALELESARSLLSTSEPRPRR